MKTTYVFDTSTLINDPSAYNQFNDSNVIIPIFVLNELDKLKKQPAEVGRNARVAIRKLDEICLKGDISTGILLDNDVLLSIDATYRNLSEPEFAGFGYCSNHSILKSNNRPPDWEKAENQLPLVQN